MLEHAGEKVRRPRGIANAVRANPDPRDERAQPLGLFRDKGKRLNGQRFCCLARGL
jgi:hypothetical protein